MSAVKGRRRRPGRPTVILQGRVSPESHAKANAIADALGVSMVSYLERLIDQDPLDADGRPIWWPEDTHDHPELDLQNAS